LRDASMRRVLRTRCARAKMLPAFLSATRTTLLILLTANSILLHTSKPHASRVRCATHPCAASCGLAALAQKCIMHGCIGAAKHMDVRERPPGIFVSHSDNPPDSVLTSICQRQRAKPT